MSAPTTTTALPDMVDLAIANVIESRRALAADIITVAEAWAVVDGLRTTIADALADAEARGRAAALAEVGAACDELADLYEFGAVVIWRIAPDRWRAEATASAESTAVGVGLTATGAILDLADCASAVAP